MALITFTLLVVLAVAAYLYLKSAFSYWRKRNVPFIAPTFPFGNFTKVFLQKCSITEQVVELYNRTAEPVIGVYVTLHPSLLIRDPKIVRDIFIADFPSFYSRGTIANEAIDPMSNNLLLQNGDKWKINRSKLTPAFSASKLRGMFKTIIECGSSLQKHIHQYSESGKTVEMREICARYALNVIASTAFGIDVDCIENPNDEFRQYALRFFELTPTNMFRSNFGFYYPKLAQLLRLRFVDKDVGDFMIELVRQIVEHREENNITRMDFMQLLMQIKNTGEVQGDDDWSTKATANGESMSLKEMAAHSFVFNAASFESTSTTMSFCLHELAKNPNLQAKVHADIDSVLEKYDGQLTYESIGEMKFIEQCIDETLRLHPPFGIIPRKCTQDYKIENTDIVIEEGTSILLPVAALHSDAKYFDEPNEFRPDRFDNEQMAHKPYFPFGEGPRKCIGLRLAKLEIKIGLVLLLQKFYFELDSQYADDELKFEPRSFAKLPVGGINLNVKQR